MHICLGRKGRSLLRSSRVWCTEQAFSAAWHPSACLDGWWLAEACIPRTVIISGHASILLAAGKRTAGKPGAAYPQMAYTSQTLQGRRGSFEEQTHTRTLLHEAHNHLPSEERKLLLVTAVPHAASRLLCQRACQPSGI